ncbi:MAG: transposase [Balneolaceae bacterium]
MGRSRYKILDSRYPYFITSSIINGYRLLTDNRLRKVIIEGLNFMVGERKVSIYAYVIMPNHLHFIAQSENLGKHVASFKSYSARRIIDLLEERNNFEWLNRLKHSNTSLKKDRDHKLWSDGFHPKQIFSAKVMRQKLNYIHYNPVKAGLVHGEDDWEYSSYGDYFGASSSLVEVEVFRG